MLGWLFGSSKNKRVETIFAEHGRLAILGAQALDTLFREPGNAAFVDRIHEVEHLGDALTREAHQIVDSMLIPKYDKEDIIQLVSSLDDITDTMRKIARKIDAFKISRSRAETKEFIAVIKAAVEGVDRIVRLLPKEKLAGISKVAIEIKELEEKGDTILHQALGNLFRDESDPKMFVIWKKILEELERITDHCEKVAEVVMTIARKHAR